MSNNNNTRIESLLDRIKQNSITWTSLDFLKKYLRENNKSLRDIPVFQLYAVYLQENKFLFDCKNTYFSITNDHLYVLSKDLNDFDFRFDKFNLHKNNDWQQAEAPVSVLLRLKNAIILTNNDSSDECEKVLSVLNQIAV